MPKIKKIAILTGGDSSERSIALASAKNVAMILRKKYQVQVFDFYRDLPQWLRTYKNFQVAIPVFHGPGGEDGVIQGFLKTLRMPFIFSDVEAHAVGMDKFLSKHLAEKIGLLIAPHKLLSKPAKVKYTKKVVVKPLSGGSSIGITIADSQAKLNRAISQAFIYSNKVLLEDYLPGEEFTVAVIDQNGKNVALPVIQIISKNKFFDYKSKYDASLVQEICPAPIKKSLTKKMQDQAIRMHQALGARHLSRTDFIVSRGKVYFLEINTIPGITKNSLLPKTLRAAGLDFGQLLEAWFKSVI